jgi:hypothetical protein
VAGFLLEEKRFERKSSAKKRSAISPSPPK